MLFSWPLTALSRGLLAHILLPGQIIRASQGVNGKSPGAPPDGRLKLLRSITGERLGAVMLQVFPVRGAGRIWLSRKKHDRQIANLPVVPLMFRC
ncbi:hypothetical protein [Rhizobium sp. BK008]|uniref:hypothetical protein n=1 Tax=Rhizobium sp. BK008 TaxID=2587094 RepID=UPI00160E9FF1|nr:hypothetical protein [Rhizobium sp. BK008]MBB4249537.1 hypothetical protein [Rhizobium sp. BK008]